jgi:hypothetical protein
MVQLVKSTKDFDIFGAEPWHRQGEHRKFKSPLRWYMVEIHPRGLSNR